MPLKLFSSDFNGTLVKQHTMSDLIRAFGSKENAVSASELFQRRLAGKIGVKDLLAGLGPLTRGITLRQAIEYVEKEITPVKGFKKFLEFLRLRDIPLLINSTGYSVTMFALRELYGREHFAGFICNRLEFGWEGNPEKGLEDDEIEDMVEAYFKERKFRKYDSYDQVQATGRVYLNIAEESAKTGHLKEFLRVNYPDIALHEVAHMGDTMGDSRAIVEVAKAGGLGLAFNYNEALEDHLTNIIKHKPLRGAIFLTAAKSDAADLRIIIDLLKR